MVDGFRSTEPIESRTNGLSDRDGNNMLVGRLLFGDGQTRGLAALYVWGLIRYLVGSADFVYTPDLERVFESLMQIPTIFGAGKPVDAA